ncbi:MAG: glycosyl hydrolase-related protein [Oscillospiraceae bacterium]|jgi:alpha-mannosidase|nr:glycosyl hydrolase-related protein [Oscillospiraceae bacterium]
MANFDVPFADKNSERYVLSRRVATIIDHIARDFLYPLSVPTGDFLLRDGQYSIGQIDQGEWREFHAETEFWGYPECYCWFRQRITVPKEFAGSPVLYEVMPHERGWNECNPQFILFANGKALQGLDSNHTYVRLLEKAQGGETFDIALNAYTDKHEWRGPVRMRARLRTIDSLALELYYDLKTPLETANLYGADDLPRVRLLKALNTACNLLELTPEGFAASAKAAIAYLKQEIYAGDKSGIAASCVGHTHIDVAWLWRLRQTRDKAGRSFATVLKYMEEYPEYVFMSPQAQLYDFVKKDYPEVYEGIKRRIKEGRWEAEGSMWVESDTNVISGESLVRQFLVGKRFFRDEFGVQTKIMWLPDVFGYSGALPQIIKKSGLDYFMTTKISWNEYDKLPCDTFLWQGIDGTRVLSHFSPGADALQERIPSFFTTYNSYLSPNQIIGGWKRYSNKDLNQEFLISYGFGDGGGGPTVDMLEHGRRMARGIEGCPLVVQQPARKFFEQLEQQVTGNPHLPVWSGELYLEYHRGTLTSQARNKRYNRKAELLYHDAETLASLARHLTGAEYPAEEMTEAWKLILLNQFHDIIPGSSIAEVYEDSKAQYEQVIAKGEYLAGRAMKAIAARLGEGVAVFNTLGFARTEIAALDSPEEITLKSDEGILPSQRSYDGQLLFLAKDIPAKGYRRFAAGPAAPELQSPIRVAGRVIRTPFAQITFDENYNISSLIELTSGGELIPQGQTANRLVAFDDRPREYDAWNLDAFFREKCWWIDDVQSAEIIEEGPVRTVLRIERRFRRSSIRQDLIFYPHTPRVDIDYAIDWHEKNVCLKCDYPVDVNARAATFDIQFGSIERPTHENSTWDFAQFEACGHKWVDLSDNGRGLAVLNDCKYGWTAKDGHLAPTLLRAPNGHHAEQDIGEHRFTFAMYPHAGQASQSNVVREGYSLNVPLRCARIQESREALPGAYELVRADRGNIVIETVKKAEDSDALIFRLYECWNRRTETTLTFGGKIGRVFECDLMEENDIPLAARGAALRLDFRPFEIKTLKVVID